MAFLKTLSDNSTSAFIARLTKSRAAIPVAAPRKPIESIPPDVPRKPAELIPPDVPRKPVEAVPVAVPPRNPSPPPRDVRTQETKAAKPADSPRKRIPKKPAKQKQYKPLKVVPPERLAEQKTVAEIAKIAPAQAVQALSDHFPSSSSQSSSSSASSASPMKPQPPVMGTGFYAVQAQEVATVTTRNANTPLASRAADCLPPYSRHRIVESNDTRLKLSAKTCVVCIQHFPDQIVPRSTAADNDALHQRFGGAHWFPQLALNTGFHTPFRLAPVGMQELRWAVMASKNCHCMKVPTIFATEIVGDRHFCKKCGYFVCPTIAASRKQDQPLFMQRLLEVGECQVLVRKPDVGSWDWQDLQAAREWGKKHSLNLGAIIKRAPPCMQEECFKRHGWSAVMTRNAQHLIVPASNESFNKAERKQAHQQQLAMSAEPDSTARCCKCGTESRDEGVIMDDSAQLKGNWGRSVNEEEIDKHKVERKGEGEFDEIGTLVLQRADRAMAIIFLDNAWVLSSNPDHLKNDAKDAMTRYYHACVRKAENSPDHSFDADRHGKLIKVMEGAYMASTKDVLKGYSADARRYIKAMQDSNAVGKSDEIDSSLRFSRDPTREEAYAPLMEQIRKELRDENAERVCKNYNPVLLAAAAVMYASFKRNDPISAYQIVSRYDKWCRKERRLTLIVSSAPVVTQVRQELRKLDPDQVVRKHKRVLLALADALFVRFKKGDAIPVRQIVESYGDWCRKTRRSDLLHAAAPPTRKSAQSSSSSSSSSSPASSSPSAAVSMDTSDLNDPAPALSASESKADLPDLLDIQSLFDSMIASPAQYLQSLTSVLGANQEDEQQMPASKRMKLEPASVSSASSSSTSFSSSSSSSSSSSHASLPAPAVVRAPSAASDRMDTSDCETTDEKEEELDSDGQDGEGDEGDEDGEEEEEETQPSPIGSKRGQFDLLTKSVRSKFEDMVSVLADSEKLNSTDNIEHACALLVQTSWRTWDGGAIESMDQYFYRPETNSGRETAMLYPPRRLMQTAMTFRRLSASVCKRSENLEEDEFLKARLLFVAYQRMEENLFLMVEKEFPSWIQTVLSKDKKRRKGQWRGLSLLAARVKPLLITQFLQTLKALWQKHKSWEPALQWIDKEMGCERTRKHMYERDPRLFHLDRDQDRPISKDRRVDTPLAMQLERITNKNKRKREDALVRSSRSAAASSSSSSSSSPVKASAIPTVKEMEADGFGEDGLKGMEIDQEDSKDEVPPSPEVKRRPASEGSRLSRLMKDSAGEYPKEHDAMYNFGGLYRALCSRSPKTLAAALLTIVATLRESDTKNSSSASSSSSSSSSSALAPDPKRLVRQPVSRVELLTGKQPVKRKAPVDMGKVKRSRMVGFLQSSREMLGGMIHEISLLFLLTDFGQEFVKD